MSLAHGLMRLFNIDIEVCDGCGGFATVIACIEDKDFIDRIPANLREEKQYSSTLA